MLSGYFVLFFDMPELSVNILVPALFLAAERLLREQRTANVILSSAVTCLLYSRRHAGKRVSGPGLWRRVLPLPARRGSGRARRTHGSN